MPFRVRTSTVLLLVASLLLAACDSGVSSGEAPREEEPPEETEDPGEPLDPGAPGRYSQEEIDYYLEIAIGSEGGSPEVIKKWSRSLRIAVGGTPTEEDSAALRRVIDDLNELTGERLALSFAEGPSNVDVLFVPADSIGDYNANYRPGNLGYFYIWWNGQYQIQRAQVLIASDEVTQEQRSHLIREELTQSLGLMNDSPRYDDSVFQRAFSTVVRTFSDLDQTIIEMHHRPGVRAGMSRREVRRALERITQQREAGSSG